MTAKIVPPALFQALNAETDEEYQGAFDRLDPEWHRTVQIIYELRSHGLDNLQIRRFIHDALARSNHPENRKVPRGVRSSTLAPPVGGRVRQRVNSSLFL